MLNFIYWFFNQHYSEQKLQKFSEIKAGLDDADVLVLRWMFSYVFVLYFYLLVLSSIHFLYHSSPSSDSENGPWGKKFAAKRKGNASRKVEGVQIWSK